MAGVFLLTHAIETTPERVAPCWKGKLTVVWPLFYAVIWFWLVPLASYLDPYGSQRKDSEVTPLAEVILPGHRLKLE